MSRTHDAQRTSFPFGNPFRMILPKGSYISPKLLPLLAPFEQTLAESLRKLKPSNTSDALSLSWLTHAMASLSKTHTNIKALTTALQFPVSEWDEKLLDMYLNNSVKLLDICNALTSELSQLDQSQLLLKYALHILSSTGTSPSSEHLKRVHSSLQDWTEKIYSKSLNLENCSSILQELTSTLDLVKVKSSAKGRVLMRALYGVKVVTIFVCSVFTAALLGCSKPLMEFSVSDDFLWAGAFNDLQVTVNGEFRNQFSLGNSVALKELWAVKGCVQKLHDISEMKEEELKTDSNKEELEKLSSDLANTVECFIKELDKLSKQLDDFFQLVLSGRNASLWSLTSSNVQLKGKADKFREDSKKIFTINSS